MTEQVIYENPEKPFPEWAIYVLTAADGEVSGLSDSIDFDGEASIDRVHRIIRRDDLAYYVPENSHTDDEGRLPHDGGPMPEHVKGRVIEVKFRDGFVDDPEPSHAYIDWGHKGTSQDIVAYRIVGDGSEGREAAEDCPDCDKLMEERDEAEGLGTELAQAVGRHFGIDVGEHSNCNDPRRAALNILNGEYQVPSRGAGDFHRPTPELRWARREKYVVPQPGLIGPQKATVLSWDEVLQQKWVSDLEGQEPEWRDVPTVRENDHA